MRPLRNTNPELLHLLTIRTLGAAFLLRPDARTNEVVGGVIAKYQNEFAIEIYAYSILSNHLHLLVRAPRGNLWRFAQAVNREIAKRVNFIRQRNGVFWGRRYDDQIVVRDEDASKALVYVLCNATNHGLVERPELWPGLHSIRQVFDRRDRYFTFTNHTAYAEAVRRNGAEKVRMDDFKEAVALKISRLPQFDGLDDKDYNRKIFGLVNARVAEIIAERRANGLGFLGAVGVRRQSPFSTPLESKRSPRPICYSACIDAIRRFRVELNTLRTLYRDASRRFRAGELSVDFPSFCLKPPSHYAVMLP